MDRSTINNLHAQQVTKLREFFLVKAQSSEPPSLNPIKILHHWTWYMILWISHFFLMLRSKGDGPKDNFIPQDIITNWTNYMWIKRYLINGETENYFLKLRVSCQLFRMRYLVRMITKLLKRMTEGHNGRNAGNAIKNRHCSALNNWLHVVSYHRLHSQKKICII